MSEAGTFFIFFFTCFGHSHPFRLHKLSSVTKIARSLLSLLGYSLMLPLDINNPPFLNKRSIEFCRGDAFYYLLVQRIVFYYFSHTDRNPFKLVKDSLFDLSIIFIIIMYIFFTNNTQ